jgi:hypothetical protein
VEFTGAGGHEAKGEGNGRGSKKAARNAEDGMVVHGFPFDISDMLR